MSPGGRPRYSSAWPHTAWQLHPGSSSSSFALEAPCNFNGFSNCLRLTASARHKPYCRLMDDAIMNAASKELTLEPGRSESLLCGRNGIAARLVLIRHQSLFKRALFQSYSIMHISIGSQLSCSRPPIAQAEVSGIAALPTQSTCRTPS